MFFNSIDFAVFLPITFVLYWYVTTKNLKAQNFLIVVASYVFYGWWDWRFLSLIAFSTIVDYTIGIALDNEQNEKKRKLLLYTSLFVNLGFLGFFKYYNFFLDNFVAAFSFFGNPINPSSLNIILPVGISFYTFQTLSYSIDIYKRKMKPTKDFIAFAAFVSFFPQLVAGPIERASHLLPQFLKSRQFNYDFAVTGARLIIWGLFKKMVIADNASVIVDGIFQNADNQSSTSLILGVFLFTFQIYCDFSGYSDIAIGTGRLFGFDLMTNFKFPYFSKNIREFWSRWHISLSTWFRDYVYFPLGGSKISKLITIRNIFIVFLVSGFWHGANWTFIVWGGIHALLYMPALFSKNIKKTNVFLGAILNFVAVAIAWVFFRAKNVREAFNYLGDMFYTDSSNNFFTKTNSYLLMTVYALLGICILLFIEYRHYKKEHHEILLPNWTLIVLMLLICFIGVFKDQSAFIYFQF